MIVTFDQYGNVVICFNIYARTLFSGHYDLCFHRIVTITGLIHEFLFNTTSTHKIFAIYVLNRSLEVSKTAKINSKQFQIFHLSSKK